MAELLVVSITKLLAEVGVKMFDLNGILMGYSALSVVSIVGITGVLGGFIRNSLNIKASNSMLFVDGKSSQGSEAVPQVQNLQTKKATIKDEILISLGGAILSPVFLNLTASKIIEFQKPSDFMIFTGVSLVSAIYAEKFMGNIVSNMLVEKAKSEIKEAKTEIQETKSIIDSDKKVIEEKRIEVTNIAENISKTAVDIKNFVSSPEVKAIIESDVFKNVSGTIMSIGASKLTELTKSNSEEIDKVIDKNGLNELNS